VGEFTTQAPGAGDHALHWGANGQVIVDGAASLRQLNRRLGLALPLGGPKTLNGLLLERLEQIPDGPCCVQLPGCHVEVMQIHDQAVRSVRLMRVPAMPGPLEARYFSGARTPPGTGPARAGRNAGAKTRNGG
jgi:Mg2+/Co2+ transporter CorB